MVSGTFLEQFLGSHCHGPQVSWQIKPSHYPYGTVFVLPEASSSNIITLVTHSLGTGFKPGGRLYDVVELS